MEEVVEMPAQIFGAYDVLAIHYSVGFLEMTKMDGGGRGRGGGGFIDGRDGGGGHGGEGHGKGGVGDAGDKG
ncbi:hypothetical protein DCAR_0623349 [Daucus carota subsp. sativus]|uniref:Uncharacterized protein n=2 Tax=Daucus carota subsp. sativus TaxID=79200 RepID=A0A164V871_DAUCS|nr:hypothetical protein DCAR_0623349 [Daucus carota subsp. sativus]